MKMLPKCKKVVCYEMDPRLASELVKKVNNSKFSNNFQLFIGDCMKQEFPYFDLCISNLPYQISSPFIFKLLNYNFRCAYIMFQREFAERLVARPGSSNYCRLSVSVQLLAQVDHVLKVSKNSFVPPPKVESSVVRIEPRMSKPILNFKDFDGLLKICFLRKNKTLLANFKGSTFLKKKSKNLEDIEFCVKKILEKLNLQHTRANKMDIDDFLELYLEFKKNDLTFI